MSDRQLLIELDSDRNAPERVAIRSARPVHAARIFAKRSVSDVRDLLPRLFSVCGIAQASASRDALATAMGQTASSSSKADDRLLVLMETAREHLWRVLIDWPAFTGHNVDDAAARDMQRLLPRLQTTECKAREAIEALDDLLRAAVFGIPADEWLTITSVADLAAWASGQTTSAARLLARVFDRDWPAVGATTVSFLPELSGPELDERLAADDADDFIAAPLWQGRPCETTPLSRTRDSDLIRTLRAEFGAGMITRLAALLVELARVPAAMHEVAAEASRCARRADDEEALPANTGIGQVDAARGRLVHRAIVEGDQVSQYQILAPTEWNFHPRGVLAESLNALDSSDTVTLTEQASLLITAIDPCVGYELRVH